MNKRKYIIETIKDNGYPVLIYGSGKFGRSVGERLDTEGIDYSFFEDDKYYSNGKYIEINGRKSIIQNVNKVIQMIKRDRNYNVLCGVINYKVLSYLKKIISVNGIIDYLDVYPDHCIDKGFIDDHYSQLQHIYNILEDEESRNVLKYFLYSRYTGDIEPLFHMYGDDKLSYDYELMNLDSDDIIIDGGAYNGDTIEEIQYYLSGNAGKIYAFEPDIASYRILSEKYQNNNNIICVNKGLWNVDTTLCFQQTGTLGSQIVEKSVDNVDVVRLDQFEELYSSKVSVIKLDVEGAELKALEGAKQIIHNNMPRLAVCIYHRNKDIIDIVDYLESIGGGGSIGQYKFYLRQHSDSVEETVLYAIPS